MRIDSNASSYSLDRPVRPGRGVVPYREIQRGVDDAAQQEVADRRQRPEPQAQPVKPAAESSDSQWRRSYAEAREARPTASASVSSYAARALDSYLTTAYYRDDQGAGLVLGIDLYA